MLRRHILGIIGRRSRWFCTIGNQEEEKRGTLQNPVWTELISRFGNERLVTKLFRRNPDLEMSDIYFWKEVTNALFKFGFKPSDCFRMIDLYPSILGYEEDTLEKTMNEWKKWSGLNTSDLKFLIMNRPEFLTLSVKTIKRRVPYLLSYCTSKDSLMTLLFLCPNVMEDDWEETLKKISYLNDEMVVYTTEVISCRALSKSLEHIKLRFSIIEKCGLYTKPNPHLHKQTQKERIKLRNPKLKEITDKSDHSFARKIAKISLEEYEVFADAFTQYDQEVDDDDSSDDDTSDSSDDE